MKRVWLACLLLLFFLPAVSAQQVSLAAYLPFQQRSVVGVVREVSDTVCILTGESVFVGQVTYFVTQRHRAYIEAEGEQVTGTERVPAFALIEVQDGTASGKIDKAQIAVLQIIGEGDFGFPGPPLPCFALTEGGDAVEIIR